MSKITFALAFATVIGSVSLAAAAPTSSYFGFQGDQDAGSTIDIDLVVSETAGVLEIYDFRKGVQGELLAVEDIRSGANTGVKVGVRNTVLGDVIAVLKSDNGSILAEREFDINRF